MTCWRSQAHGWVGASLPLCNPCTLSLSRPFVQPSLAMTDINNSSISKQRRIQLVSYKNDHRLLQWRALRNESFHHTSHAKWRAPQAQLRAILTYVFKHLIDCLILTLSSPLLMHSAQAVLFTATCDTTARSVSLKLLIQLQRLFVRSIRWSECITVIYMLIRMNHCQD